MDTERLYRAYLEATDAYVATMLTPSRSSDATMDTCAVHVRTSSALRLYLFEAVRKADAAGRARPEAVMLAIVAFAPCGWRYAARCKDGTFALAKGVDKRGHLVDWIGICSSRHVPRDPGVLTIDTVRPKMLATYPLREDRGPRADVYPVAYGDPNTLDLLALYVIADSAVWILERHLPVAHLPELVLSYCVRKINWLQ